MYAASTYEEIERYEREVENAEIVVFLFVKATETDILKEFEYIHYNSANYCSVYAIGYTDEAEKDNTYRKVEVYMDNDWYYSAKAFTDFKKKLRKRIHWTYSGEVDILILQNNPGSSNSLNFQNYEASLEDVGKLLRTNL